MGRNLDAKTQPQARYPGNQVSVSPKYKTVETFVPECRDGHVLSMTFKALSVMRRVDGIGGNSNCVTLAKRPNCHRRPQ